MIQLDNKKLMAILIGGIGLLVFVIVIAILSNLGGGTGSQPATLQFWGVFDDRTDFDQVIRDFQNRHSNVQIVYRLFTYEEYESALINALAAGSGPDIFMIHHTWMPKHGDKLAPMPATFNSETDIPMTIRDFQNQFVEVAVNDLTYNNQIYAIPLYVDTLALYYNRDMFNAAGITFPPATWDDFNSAVAQLTKLDAAGNIVQSGAAIGTATNINRSTDILAALMIQSGVQMTDSTNSSATFSRSIGNTQVGEISLRYYTDFANPAVTTYSWNSAQHYSIDAFVEGKTAMMFNYSHQMATINARNPRLNYAVAPMPQVSETDKRTYANYWAVGVSNKSLYQNQAWMFLNYLGSQPGSSAYLTQTGRPAARRDIINLQASDLTLGVFASQALTARSWFQVDNTAIETIFADMISDVNLGRLSIREALQNAESRVNVLMSRPRAR